MYIKLGDMHEIVSSSYALKMCFSKLRDEF